MMFDPEKWRCRHCYTPGQDVCNSFGRLVAVEINATLYKEVKKIGKGCVSCYEDPVLIKNSQFHHYICSRCECPVADTSEKLLELYPDKGQLIDAIREMAVDIRIMNLSKICKKFDISSFSVDQLVLLSYESLSFVLHEIKRENCNE